MRKRKRELNEEPLNQDRWLISYADFITLLFAFFVVMYAISVVNQDKYKVLALSLKETFGGIGAGYVGHYGVVASPNDISTVPEDITASTFYEDRTIALLVTTFESNFRGLMDDGKISIRKDKDWIEINLQADILFQEGSAFISKDAEDMLFSIVKLLRLNKYPITVEGYTDDVPIKNEIYPSNWHLSADRSIQLVQYFINNGINPLRVAATGFGEYYPVASNKTALGRAQNRRVLILVERTNKRRQFILDSLEPDYYLQNFRSQNQ